MASTEWYNIVLPLLGGGAAGAVITLIASSIRSKIQPVGHRVDILPVFKQTLGESSLVTKVSVNDSGKEYQFHNLFLIDIQMVNRGNKDMIEFPFGITLSTNDKIVYVEKGSSDRHHLIEQQQIVGPENLGNEIDFILKPFNRKDSYYIRLYVVLPENSIEPGKIVFSSPQSVKFTDMPTLSEIAGKLAESTVFNVGGISVSLSMRNKYIRKK